MAASPGSASAGWRNTAGVPVLVSVAAIFWPIRPLFPTPATTSLPRQAAMASTARTNAGPGPDPGSPHLVGVEHLPPRAVVLENPLDRFAHGPEPGPRSGHRAREAHDLGARVGHRDRPAHALQERHVGQVVAHHRALVPARALAGTDRLGDRHLVPDPEVVLEAQVVHARLHGERGAPADHDRTHA